MIKLNPFLFILLCNFSYLHAQNLRNESGDVDTALTDGIEVKKELNLITGVGISEFAQQDYMVSPLMYSGFGTGAQAGLQCIKNKSITRFSFNWNKAILHNNLLARHYSIEATHINSFINVYYSIDKLKPAQTKSYIGWQLVQNSDFRRSSQFQNASLTYNFSCSVAPAYRIEKLYRLHENNKRWIFKKGFNLQWNYQFALPVFSALSRPNYNSIRLLRDGNGNRYENSIQKEVIDNVQFYSINKLLALDSKLEMQYLMQNGNKWALQLNLYFEKFSKPSYQYKSSFTGIFLCFYSRLNK